MRRKLGIVDKAIDRAGYWYTGWGLLSGLLAWLWSEVPFLHDLGWATYVLIGLFSSAALMVAVTGSLALYRRFNPIQISGPSSIAASGDLLESRADTPGENYELLEILTNFSVDHINPTIFALGELQEKILQHFSSNETVSAFAAQGLFHRDWGVREMNKAYSALCAFGGSPQPNYTLREMIDFVDTIEKNYHYFVGQLGEIVERLNISPQDDNDFSTLWKDWRNKHEALKEAYEPIKRMRRLGKPLYRPGLDSRWGEAI